MSAKFKAVRAPKKKATQVAFFKFAQGPDQLRVLSTSLFFAIQGIMARS
jgi:hypothetical protein